MSFQQTFKDYLTTISKRNQQGICIGYLKANPLSVKNQTIIDAEVLDAALDYAIKLDTALLDYEMLDKEVTILENTLRDLLTMAGVAPGSTVRITIDGIMYSVCFTKYNGVENMKLSYKLDYAA